jgi:hypothetical protein
MPIKRPRDWFAEKFANFYSRGSNALEFVISERVALRQLHVIIGDRRITRYPLPSGPEGGFDVDRGSSTIASLVAQPTSFVGKTILRPHDDFENRPQTERLAVDISRWSTGGGCMRGFVRRIGNATNIANVRSGSGIGGT